MKALKLFVLAGLVALACGTANSAGRFYVALASGAWNVYLQGNDGKPTFSTRIDVN